MSWDAAFEAMLTRQRVRVAWKANEIVEHYHQQIARLHTQDGQEMVTTTRGAKQPTGSGSYDERRVTNAE